MTRRLPLLRACALAIGLLASVLFGATKARAQVHVVMPDCRPAHLDVRLLAELLVVELSGEVIVEIDAAICEADATTAFVTVRTGHQVELQRLPIVGDDPAGRARALALVIAERAHLLSLEASVSPQPPDSSDAPSSEARGEGEDAERIETEEPSESEEPEPSEEDLEVGEPVALPRPPAARREERAAPVIALPPSMEVVVLGRMAPIFPITLALGVRAEVNAHIDRFWSLGIGVTTMWSHHDVLDFAPHVVIGALSGSVGWTPYREHGFDMVLRTRGAIGAGFVGGQGVSETAVLWATLGGDATLLIWPNRSLAVVLEMGATGVIAGISVFNEFGGPIVRLRDLLIDATVGFRVPLE